MNSGEFGNQLSGKLMQFAGFFRSVSRRLSHTTSELPPGVGLYRQPACMLTHRPDVYSDPYLYPKAGVVAANYHQIQGFGYGSHTTPNNLAIPYTL